MCSCIRCLAIQSVWNVFVVNLTHTNEQIPSYGRVTQRMIPIFSGRASPMSETTPTACPTQEKRMGRYR